MAMPTTWAATALRDLMARGWGLTDASVWQGFLVVLGWCIFFLFISSRGVRNRD
jgi:ABC-type multidrug transport system permease subunit